MFIGQLAGGGAEKVLTMLANHYVEKGNQVDIVTLLGSQVDRRHFNLKERVIIKDLSINGSYVKNIIPWLRRIRLYLKNNKPDVIISFIGRINALVLTASYGLKIPVIVSERSDPRHDGRGKLMLMYCNWIYNRAKAIVFQTSYQRDCFSKALSKRSFIIPNPIDILPQADSFDENLVITTGRLHPAKNQSLLIKAMNLVRLQIPNVKCEIYGDGELQDSLQKEIIDLGLSEVVRLAGKKSNVTDYVAKCKLFVMSSDYEGLSNSLMEAMMLGKICISTNYSGVEDLIEDGINGIIVPCGNAELLAKEIIKALKTNDYYLGQNARLKMLGYDEDSVLAKWDSIVETLTTN